MAPDTLEAAYAPFIASLLAGGFSQPADDSWPADLVAAHVARNNDLIAHTAEQVTAGLEVSYDNAAAVDNDELASYAASVGAWPGWLAKSSEAPPGRPGRLRLSVTGRTPWCTL